MSMRRYRKKRLWIVVVLPLLFGGALMAVDEWDQRDSTIAWAEVQRGDFVISLRASGEIQAVRSVNLSAPYVRSRLQITALVPDGTRVKKGDVLCQFDTADLEKQREDSLTRLKQVQEEIERRQAEATIERGALAVELKRTEFTLERARIRYQATNQLVDGGLKPPNELRDAELSQTEAELSLQQVKQRIAATERSNQAQLAILELNRRYTESTLALTEEYLHGLTLRAPTDGLVVLSANPQTRQKVQNGDAVWPGMMLISLPDLSSMEVVLEVNEVDIGQLKAGQEANVRLDAYPGPEFRATVKRIASLARQRNWQSPVKVFDVILELQETDPRMRPGMTVSADVIIERLPGVLTIPQQAVFQKDGRDIVYVVQGSLAQARQVKTGQRNLTHVIIEAGLHEGERVALRDPMVEPERSSEPDQSRPVLPSALAVKQEKDE